MKTTSILILLSLFYALNIMMRHDVDETKYFELAERAGGSFIRLNTGCGIFLQDNWIITAAHVAVVPQIGEDVQVNGKS